MKQLLGAGGGLLGGGSLCDGLPEGANDEDGVLGQPSQSLSHYRDEVHPCRAAGRKVLCQLAPDPNLQSMARSRGSPMQGELLQRGNHVDIQRCRAATAPGGEEYVCRPGVGVGDQTGSFSCWGQGRRPGS